jgi:hypothetical protein
MKINCLSCGHKLDLDDAYDDFEGQVKCFVCDALLDVELSEGSVRSVKVSELGRPRRVMANAGNRAAGGRATWTAKRIAKTENTSMP